MGGRQSGFTTVSSIIGGVTLVLIAGGVFLYSDRAAERDAQAVELGLLTAKVEALEAALAKTQTLNGRAATSSAPGPAFSHPGKAGQANPAGIPPSDGSPLADEGARRLRENPAQAAERRAREALIMEEALSRQPLDVAWSNTVAMELEQGLNDPDLTGTKFVNAKCRETLCRVDLLHNTEEDMGKFLDSIGNIEGFGNTSFYWQRQSNADGSSSMTMYVAREGQELPDLREQ